MEIVGRSSRHKSECPSKESTPVQAVLIADCYDNELSPLANPKCLIPIVNRPLLDYTLNCLSHARVQEVILFCSMHADEIKKFVRNGCWGRMTITVVISEGCRSLGDAMRDLDAKSIIRGDFILLTGNVVGNIQLLNALDRHKRYQLNDKGTAMTLIYKECGKKRKNRQNDVYLVVDAASSRLLYYDKNPDSRQKLNVPLEILLERDEVDIRSDLLDTGVCICSVSVPPLFSDNFDFQTKDDFVRGLLMNDEILESSVYCHLTAQGEYAASVTNWNDYHFISHDIIHRWTYPQVPDTCYDELYSYRRNNVYIQEGISLATGCSIVEDVVIGSGTTVGEKAIVSSSVIGKNCDIAENAIVQYSYLFNNVKIGSNCKIQYCVLGEGCIVETGSSVIHSILGPGVVVETESNVCATRLQSTPPEIGGGDDKETKRGDRAYVYRPDDEFESDSDSEVMELQNRNDWIGLVDNSVKEEDESSDSDGETDNDQMSNEGIPFQDDTNVFYSEVIDSLIRGYEDDILVQNLVLEVNSSRYAYNMTLSEVNYYVTRAVLSLADKELATNQNRWQTTDKLITYFLPLLKNYVRNSLAMMDCLNAIEDSAETDANIKTNIVKLLHTLYDKELLTEEAILHWNQNPREEETTPGTPAGPSRHALHLRKQIGPFIKWLEEADEQSSSGDDSD